MPHTEGKPPLCRRLAFTSRNHLIWFAASMAALCLALLYGPRDPAPCAANAAVHAVTSGRAAYLVSRRRNDPAVYTANCIWFNAALACAYLALFAVFSVRAGG